MLGIIFCWTICPPLFGKDLKIFRSQTDRSAGSDQQLSFVETRVKFPNSCIIFLRSTNFSSSIIKNNPTLISTIQRDRPRYQRAVVVSHILNERNAIREPRAIVQLRGVTVTAHLGEPIRD